MFKNTLQGNCKMFDYKYSDIIGITVKEFFENSLLDFSTVVSLKTGELNPCNNKDRKKKGYTPKDEKEAIYNHCKFSITNDKYTNFSGSVHEYLNNGINYNDFTFQDLITVIKDLHEKFKINPFLDLIHNVEFGVNIILPFDTQTFLKSIISFKGKEYELRRFKGKGYMIKFSFDQYEIKIYDKGYQNNLPDNILRFEIKVTTMQFLKAKGIDLRTSVDMLNPDIHKQLGNLLTEYFKRLVFYDNSIKLSELNKRDKRLLIDGQNPKYWSNLKETNPELFKKKVKRFRELVNKYGKQNLQETVCNLISEKWNQLTQIDLHTYQNLLEYLSKIKPETFPKITAQTLPEITDLPKTNFPQNNTSNSVLFQGKENNKGRRFCLTCGRDITDQKKGSKYCSEKKYGREVKKCRNDKSNPRNNFKKREKKIRSKGILFDITPFLKREKISC